MIVEPLDFTEVKEKKSSLHLAERGGNLTRREKKMNVNRAIARPTPKMGWVESFSFWGRNLEYPTSRDDYFYTFPTSKAAEAAALEVGGCTAIRRDREWVALAQVPE